MSDVNSTEYLIEEVFVQSLTALTRIGNVQHFQTDNQGDWPLISVKCVIREEDPARIRVAGKAMARYNVFIALEYPITAAAGDAAFVSAVQVDYTKTEVLLAIQGAGSSAAITNFKYFEIEPLSEGEQDVEPDQAEKPTLRVVVASLEAIVLRG